jgi:putative transferase (TIGR04331 family)
MKKKLYNFIFSRKNIISKNKNSILIGRWILNNNLRLNNNFQIYKYHWIDEKIRLQDFFYIKKIYNRVLKNIIPILNKFNSKKYKVRHWELIIFYFLSSYIFFSFDRWKIINNIKKRYKLNKVEIFTFEKNSMVTHDTEEFLELIKTDKWSDWIVSEIIRFNNLKFFETKKKNIQKKITKNENIYILKLYKYFFPRNENKIFLRSLHLPKIVKLGLNLKLRQFNISSLMSSFSFFSKNLVVSRCKNYSDQRKLFSKINASDKFEKFIYQSLPKILPTSFFENFKKIDENLKYLNWPKKPKTIFTSYDHLVNEPFKVYTANNVLAGSKLFLLQHGHSGHHDYSGVYYENRVCDKYLSWGNISIDKKINPLFVTTNIGKKFKKKNPKGILLSFHEYRLSPWKQGFYPREIDTIDIFKKNLFNFFDDLDKNILMNLTAKCYTTDGLNYISKDLIKKYRDIRYMTTNKNKRGFELSENYQLCIETINSTGFLEKLSLNIPVVLLTKKKFFIVKKEYKKFYDALIQNEIILFDPKKAAKLINSNLNNINDWWLDKKRQAGIKYFCSNMCRYENSLKNSINIISKKLVNKN